jgi:hypothetical protein
MNFDNATQDASAAIKTKRKEKTNPMGLSADALDASAWKSESRTAAEASESRRLSASVDGPTAGVESPAKKLVSAPANFAWPVRTSECLFVLRILSLVDLCLTISFVLEYFYRRTSFGR